MLKKVAIIIIILVYGLSSTGAIVHLDYCCGKLSNISLAASEKEKKECKQIEFKGKSCCDSKQVHLSVKGEQEAIQKANNIVSPSILFHSIFDTANTQHSVRNSLPLSTGPPLLFNSPPLFIEHCVFLI